MHAKRTKSEAFKAMDPTLMVWDFELHVKGEGVLGLQQIDCPAHGNAEGT